MTIRPATRADVPLIRRLALEIWPATYRDLMPAAQLEFMLHDMYSEAALSEQFGGLDFFIAEREGQAVLREFMLRAALENARDEIRRLRSRARP